LKTVGAPKGAPTISWLGIGYALPCARMPSLARRHWRASAYPSSPLTLPASAAGCEGPSWWRPWKQGRWTGTELKKVRASSRRAPSNCL